MRYDLTDFEWSVIEPLLPRKRRGVKPKKNRRVLNGIFWVLRTGAPWRDMPERYGPYTTAYNRFNRWRKAGIWDRLMDAIVKAHDGNVQMIDSSIVRVHQHASGVATALSGWLRALAGGTAQSGGWDGFISLSDTDPGDGNDYGITNNSGQLQGFAWGELNVGWVDFSFASTTYGTCSATAGTVHTCDMQDGGGVYRRVVHTETNMSCQQNVTYTMCTPPQFCSPGVPTCLTPPPTPVPGAGELTGHLTARPNLVGRDATTTVYWAITNVTGCTVTSTNGSSWTGAYSATSSCATHHLTGCTSLPITRQTIYTLTCNTLDSPPQIFRETATVNILPTFEENCGPGYVRVGGRCEVLSP